MASPKPLEHLSLFNHPEAWTGFDTETILSMRRYMYRIVVPLDARTLKPSNHLEVLQETALSVNPVALEVGVSTLPPHRLEMHPGLLPSGPLVRTNTLDILSEPEVSRVAQRISAKDIPASESIWQLIDYDYSLDQIARMLSIGLLGKLDSRRLVPTHAAYKAVIDSYANRAVMELTDKRHASECRLYMGTHLGESMIIALRPGESRVDYVRMDDTPTGRKIGTSFEGLHLSPTDSKTALYGDHARFAMYHRMVGLNESSHAVILHYVKSNRNDILGPWTARAAVSQALESEPVVLDEPSNLIEIVQSVITPSLDEWALGKSLLERINPSVLKESAPVLK